MRQIPLGARGTSALWVQPEHLANRFKDAMLPQVLATPVMILIMENAALNAIRPFLDAGEKWWIWVVGLPRSDGFFGIAEHRFDRVFPGVVGRGALRLQLVDQCPQSA
jgi:hypothetical protein